jgi:MFS family permease
MVGAQAIMADVVSPRERGKYSGYFGAVFGVTSVAGPLVGGFFVDNLSWRWVFYVNLPFGIVALAVGATVLHLPSRAVAHTIDYLGAALLSGGVTCVVLLTSWGGTQYAWSSPTTIGLAVGAVVLLTSFVLAELRAAEPIIPMSLFRGSVFPVAGAIGFIVGFALFGAITFLPQYQQIVRGASATGSGLQLLPLMAGILITSIGSGQLITRFGRYRPYPIVGTAVMTLGLFLLSRLGTETSAATAGLYMFVLGAGLGLVMQVLVLAVQNSVDPRDLGTATSATTFFRSIGGSFGVSIFGSIFNSQLADNLRDRLPSSAGSSLSGSVSASQLDQLPAALQSIYRSAFTDAIQTVFLVAVPFAVAAFVLTWFLREIPLRSGAPALAGVSESFGMPQIGIAAVREEGLARIQAAQSALDRLDELAQARDTPPDVIGRIRDVLAARIEYLTEKTNLPATMSGVPPQLWKVTREALRIERIALAGTLVSMPDRSAADTVRHERGVRIAAAQAALRHVDEATQGTDLPAELVDEVRGLFTGRIDRIRQGSVAAHDQTDLSDELWELIGDLLQTERSTLAKLTSSHQLSPAAGDRAEHDLDVEESALSGSAPR